MKADKANAYVGAFLDGEYEASLSALEGVLEDSPEDAQALLYKSYNLGALWKIREALETLWRVREPGILAAEISKIRSVYEFFVANERPEKIPKKKPKRLPAIRKKSGSGSEVAEPGTPARSVGIENPNLGPENLAVPQISAYRALEFPERRPETAESMLEASGFSDAETLAKARTAGAMNAHDVRQLWNLVAKKDHIGIAMFLKALKDRNDVLEILSESNVVSPRTHRTIVAKIAETHAEFGLAWIECNIGHQRFASLMKTTKPLEAQEAPKKAAEESPAYAAVRHAFAFVNRTLEHASLLRDDRSRLAYFKMAFLFFAFLATLAFLSEKFGGAPVKSDAASSRLPIESGIECESGKGVGKLGKNANGRYVCGIEYCAPGHHLVDDGCENDSRSCQIPNGNGTQEWKKSGWGACVATVCESGYALREGSCLSVFPGCDSPDIRIGKTIWAACDAEKRALFSVNDRSYYDADSALEACGEDYRLPTENDYRAAWTATASRSEEANALIKILWLDLNGIGRFDRTVELAGKVGRYATSTKMALSQTGSESLSAFSFAAGIPERGARFTVVPIETPVSVRCVRR